MKIVSICLFLICFIVPISLAESDVERSMDVPYDKRLDLSPLTFIEGDTAFMTIYGSLRGEDERLVWKDLILIGRKYKEVKNIVVYLDSYGGIAKSGFAIGDHFRGVENKYNLSVHASGIVASAAAMVFSSFEKRYAAPNTMFMVHEIRQGGDSEYTASDVKAIDRMFDSMTERYIDILCKVSNLSSEIWREKLEDTEYFWADQAKEWGLVTEVK